MTYKVTFKAGHSIEVAKNIAETLFKQLENSANCVGLYNKCSDDNEDFAVINVLDISSPMPRLPPEIMAILISIYLNCHG